MYIDKMAIVSPKAQVGENVYIGPFCVVGDNVKIGNNTRLIANVHIMGWTEIGDNNVFHPNAVIGDEPQDLAYKGDESYVIIGNNNVFRENTTVHRGTKAGSKTIIGNDCFFMAGAHIAHNCEVADKVIMVNNALLGGYVKVFSGAFISGGTAIHQFTRVGNMAMLSGLSAISKDLPPYCIADGRNGAIKGLNLVALKRANIRGERLDALKQIFKLQGI